MSYSSSVSAPPPLKRWITVTQSKSPPGDITGTKGIPVKLPVVDPDARPKSLKAISPTPFSVNAFPLTLL